MANLNIDMIGSRLIAKMARGQMVRLLYFGSSNTQRRIPGMHWADWLELGCKNHWGRGLFQAFNLGVGGETTRDLLGRFERDVATLVPDAVFVTIGGNDSGPAADMSADEYRGNLLKLHDLICGCGAMTIFQTYYGCDLENVDREEGQKMNAFMQVMRDVAADTDLPLIDQYQRWQPIMDQRDYVQRLLIDPFHVTELGNMVMGLNLLRVFDCPLTDEMAKYGHEGIQIDSLLQELSI